MRRLLLNFSNAYLASFLSGILVSLAANLAVAAFLTDKLPITHARVYSMASCFLIASIGAFGIGVVLEAARREWELGGCQQDQAVRQGFVETRKVTLLFLGFLAVCGITAAFWVVLG